MALGRERHERIDLAHRLSHHVERDLGAGDVGDDEVEDERPRHRLREHAVDRRRRPACRLDQQGGGAHRLRGLEPLGLVVDLLQTLDGVALGDRQLGEDRRDPVAELALLVRGRGSTTGTSATTYSGSLIRRCLKYRRRPPAAIARMTSLTVAPSTGARARLIWASVAFCQPMRRSRPISSLRNVLRQRGPPAAIRGERLRRLQRPRRAAHRRADRRARPAPGGADGAGDHLARGRGQQRRLRRARRAPGLVLLVLSSLGTDVEDRGPDVDRRDSVDERVVGLGDEGVPVAPQALDHVDLPRRPRLVERLRHHVADQLAQLGLASRGAARAAAARGGGRRTRDRRPRRGWRAQAASWSPAGESEGRARGGG